MSGVYFDLKLNQAVKRVWRCCRVTWPQQIKRANRANSAHLAI